MNEPVIWTGPQPHIQLSTGNSSARLMFFTPRQIPNFARRPLQYDFSKSGFTDEVTRRLEETNQARGWNPARAVMTDSESMLTAILPTSQAEEVHLQSFEDYWTFVLIITENVDIGANPMVPEYRPTFKIFSGYVLDEPVLPATMGGAEVTNPNAWLVTTHYTDANCGLDNRFSVQNNRDYVTPQWLYQVQPGSTLRPLRPDKIASAITAFADPYARDTISTSPVEFERTDDTIHVIDTKWNSPVHHATAMVDSLSRAVTTAKWAGNGGDYELGMGSYNFNNSNSGNVATRQFMGAVAQTFQSESQPLRLWAPNSGNQTITPDRSFSIAELEHTYPNISVQSFPSVKELQCAIADPMTPNRTNMCSSLISAALPSIMLDNGFCDLAMRYTSLGQTGNLPGQYDIQIANLMYNTTDGNYANKLNALIHELISSVFSLIVHVSHFDVNISCSIMGNTLVDLKLYECPSEMQNGFVVTNNSLGGLNSPLVGNEAVGNININELTNVFGSCAKSTLTVQPPKTDIGIL